MIRLENSNDSLSLLLEGLNRAANIITSTMGGTGKNVLLFEKRNLSFTKDGVSVARKIQFKNPELDAGAQLLINAANQTVQECGDGTTLTSLFTQNFVNRLFKESQNRDINEILEEAQAEIKKVTEYLINTSTKIESVSQIYNIALTSSKSEKIAKLIQEIYNQTGLKASISVEQSQNFNYTYYEISKGLNLDSGLVHPQFGNQLNGNYSAENPYIWIVDGDVTSPQDYANHLDDFNKKNIPLVMIAKDYSEAFIRFALSNKIQQGLDICLLKYPGFGESVVENIKDIKVFLTRGFCNKITVTPYEFTIYNKTDKKIIRKRLEQLNAQLDVAQVEFDKLSILKRIANLEQVSAIIYVGGITKKNAEEEFDRIEDAVGSCQSALKMGVVKGTGVALYEYAQENQENLPRWFYELLKEPAYKILNNANIKLEPVYEAFNVKTKQMDPKLVDSTHVIVHSLLNSFAMAELVINTSYILYD